MDSEKKKNSQQIPVQAEERVIGGFYSNTAKIAHTKEEFVMDFFLVFPPAAKLGARVVVAPSHAKRLVRALNENIAKYEQNFGPISEVPDPPKPPIVH